MNTKINKLRIIGYASIILLVALFSILPEKAMAAKAFGSVTETLRDNVKLHELWNIVLSMLNSLVVILLIVTAFTEILRINIDTYGFKKVLPTLVLAIIAANFSYILCRLLVDISNVALTYFTNNGQLVENLKAKGFSSTSTYGLTANFTWTPGDYLSIFRELIAIIFNLAAAIVVLVLVFLFWVRTAVIYLLTVAAPVAFMAMALPQTKNLFNQWWQQLVKWVFMPIPAVGILWVGSTIINVLGQGDDSMTLVSMVVAGLCLYGAVAIPFKLGGPVMAGFAKYTGAQYLADKTKEFAVTKAKGLGLRAWNNYQMVGLNMKREGKNGLTRFIGGHWIGTGLAKAKADLSFEEDFSKGLEEGIQARHFQDKGDNHVLRRGYRQNRSGEIKEFENYATERLIKKGMQEEAAGRVYKPYKKLSDWRAQTAQAKVRMSTAEEAETNLIRNGSKLLLRELSGEKIAPERKKELLDLFGLTEGQYTDFMNYYKRVTSNKTIKEMEEPKSQKDPIKDAMNDITAAHNVIDFHDQVSEYTNLMAKHGKFFKAMLANDTATLATMNTAQKAGYDADLEVMKNVKTNLPMLKKVAIDMKALTREESERMETDDTVIKKMSDHAEGNFADKVEQIEGMIKKNNNQIPLHMMDMVSRGSDGKLILKKMDAFAASRARIWVDRDTSEGASEWVTQYGIPAMSASLVNGLPYESFISKDVVNVHLRKLDPERNTKAARKATQAYESVVRSMVAGSQVQRTQATEGYLEFLKHNMGEDGMADDIGEIAKRMMTDFSSTQTQAALVKAGGADIMSRIEEIKVLRESGADLTTAANKAKIAEFTKTIMETFKGASTMSGGGGTTSLIINSILGERARIGEARVQ